MSRLSSCFVRLSLIVVLLMILNSRNASAQVRTPLAHPEKLEELRLRVDSAKVDSTDLVPSDSLVCQDTRLMFTFGWHRRSGFGLVYLNFLPCKLKNGFGLSNFKKMSVVGISQLTNDSISLTGVMTESQLFTLRTQTKPISLEFALGVGGILGLETDETAESLHIIGIGGDVFARPSLRLSVFPLFWIQKLRHLEIGIEKTHYYGLRGNWGGTSLFFGFRGYFR